MTRKQIYSILQTFLLETYHYERLPKHINFIIKDVLKKASHVIVSDYYRSGYKGGFLDFVRNLLVQQSNIFVSLTITAIINTFIEIIGYYEQELGYEVIQVIGDLHDIKHTKLLCIKNNQKIVVYHSEYNSESTILSILMKHDPSLRHYFPHFHTQGSVTEREFIEYKLTANSEKTVKQYYRNLGYILSYFVFLRGVDMHYDNVCCNIPYPCFFDIETLFSQTLTYEELYQGSFSLNFTSIIYNDTIGEGNHSVVFGPLFKGVTLYYPFIVFRNNQPSIKRKKYFHRDNHSLPLLNNKPVNVFDYGDDILMGYKKGCKKLFTIGSDIIQDIQHSKNIYKRTLVHKTSFYEGLQRYVGYKSHEPGYTEEMVQLITQAPTYIVCDINPKGIQYIINELQHGSVPIFYSNIADTAIIDKDGIIVGHTPISSLQKTFTLEDWKERLINNTPRIVGEIEHMKHKKIPIYIRNLL